MMEPEESFEDQAPLEAPTGTTFVPPSIHETPLTIGASYSHYSPLPPAILTDPTIECALGIDEAGRGPVLGPMVYALLYLPLHLEPALLTDPSHRFDDSKILTPLVRSNLMRELCTPGTPLHNSCGWATSVMSARDISAGMLQPSANGGAGGYNLNAQAYDATAALLAGVLAQGVNVRKVFVDTVGQPAAHQARLQRIFPTLDITVAKKADSLYPCVSAASVCAKVTRDAALEALWSAQKCKAQATDSQEQAAEPDWGSGYPSDARCSTWLKRNMDPFFGWAAECRFSWGTAKELLEPTGKSSNSGVRVDWPAPEADEELDSMRVTDFFAAGADAAGSREEEQGGLGSWFGTRVTEEVF